MNEHGVSGIQITFSNRSSRMNFILRLLPVLMMASAVLAIDQSTESAQRVSVGSESAQLADTTAPTADSVQTGMTAAATPDSSRCTLEVITTPPSATVLMDGTVRGVSPCIIPDVDTGRHTLVIQLAGHYQKRLTVTGVAGRINRISVQLTAPARLSVASEPSGALVSLNGERKGATPWIDSLAKPGIYHLTIEKESYETIKDSITVPVGGIYARTDTLRHTVAYTDSVASETKAAKVARRRFSTSLIAGVFGAFLLTLLIIEARE